MKTNFFISSRLGAVYRGFSALTSEASCSSYFMITRPGPKTRAQGLGLGPRPGPWPGPGPRANGRAEIIENIAHRKDAQRNSVQKDVLNSSPSFFSNLFVKKALVLKKRFSVVPFACWKWEFCFSDQRFKCLAFLKSEGSAFRIRDLSVWPS